MNTDLLITFLLKARTKTYAAGGGKVKPLLNGSKQLEYSESDWLYRDIYNIGNGIFPGIETIYFKHQPVYSMSYFGDFSKMTEKEADAMLRRALLDFWNKTRIWNVVTHDYGVFQYHCEGEGGIGKFKGVETIYKNGREIYYFQYAGGLIGEE